MKRYNSSLKQKCFAVALTSLTSIAHVSAQNAFEKDTVKLYADKQIISWKGIDLKLHGELLKITLIGSSYNKGIELSHRPAAGLIEIYFIIEYENNSEKAANYYLMVDGEKHNIELTCSLRFVSNKSKDFLYLQRDGYISSKHFHCDHYSHASHYSSHPKR